MRVASITCRRRPGNTICRAPLIRTNRPDTLRSLTLSGPVLLFGLVTCSQDRSSEPRLTIVFVSYNSARDLDRALASLAATTPDLPTRTLVIENGSELAAVRATCARFGAGLIAPGRNLGYGPAANRAAVGVLTEYLAIANPDIVFQPETLRQLVEFLDRCPTAGVVAPQLFYPDGRTQPSARRRPGFRYFFAGRRSPLVRWFGAGRSARDFQYLGSEHRQEPLAVDAVIGAFMLFRRRAFTAVNGFDPGYFMFMEDVDICLRLAPGWGVYLLPAARLVHAVGSARRRVRAFTEYHRLRSLRRLFRRSHVRALGPVIDLVFAGGLALFLALGTLGIGEFEYSWKARRTREKCTRS